MNRAVTRTALAQLTRRPLQASLLAAVFTLASATLTLALTLGDTATAPYDRVMEESNGAHAWLQSGDRATLDEIASQPGVIGVAGPYQRQVGTAEVNGKRVDLGLWGMDATLPEVGKPIITAGRWFDGLELNEAVLEAGLANALGIEPGESLRVTSGGTQMTLRVVGVAILQQRAPYPIWGPGHVVVVRERMVTSAGNEASWEMGVQLSDPGGVRALLPPPGSGTAIGITSWGDIRDAVAEDAQVTIIFFRVFSVFAIAGVGFIVANMAGSQVLAQVRQIGILKAIGFTPGQVALAFLGSTVAIAFAGASAGVLVGSFAAPRLIGDAAGVLSIPGGVRISWQALVTVIVSIPSIAVLFALLPAWQAGRTPAVSAIRGWRVEAGTPARLSRVALALRLPPLVALGLKDAFARPFRAWLTVSVIALAVATGAMTLTIQRTLTRATSDPSLFANEPYHLGVHQLPAAEVERLAAEAAAMEGVTGVVTEWTALASVAGTDGPFSLTAVDTDPATIRQVTRGRAPDAAGEVLLTERFASDYGIRIGESITVSLATFGGAGLGADPKQLGEKTLTVTGLYHDGDDDGRTAYTVASTVANVAGELPAGLGIRLADTDDADRVFEALTVTAGEGARLTNEVRENREDLEAILADTRPVLAGLNGVLIAIAAVNVLVTLLFAVRERYRDIGVLKAIGLTPAQVVAAIAIGAAVLSLLATVVGVPAGLWVSDALFNYYGKDGGWRDGIAEFPAAWQLGMLVPAAAAVAVAGAVIPAVRAARLPASEALRSE